MTSKTSNRDSTTSEVLHELDAARWHALEQMILEERASRSKEVAEIREVLAMVSAQHNLQQPSKSLDMDETELCRGRTRKEVTEGKSSTSHVDIQSFDKLTADMRENFTSRLLEFEAKFQALADRHMSLFEHHLQSTGQLKETIKEAEQVDPAEKHVRDTNYVTSKSWSQGSLGSHASGQFKRPTWIVENASSPRSNLLRSLAQAPLSRLISAPENTPEKVQVCRGAATLIDASPTSSKRSVVQRYQHHATASPTSSKRSEVQSYQHHAQIFSPSLRARQVFSPEAGPIKPCDIPGRRRSIH